MTIGRSIIGAALGILAIPLAAAAQGHAGGIPAAVDAVVRLEKHYGDYLPGDASFVDDRGHRVRLSDLYGDRPLVVSLNYSDCPMLCQVQLREFVSTFSAAGLEPLRDFDIVSISLDPNETTERARETKRKYVELSGKPASADGWHFLTGDKRQIDRVAAAVGVDYVYLADRKEYSHPAVFTICTGDGRISQYLEGVGLDPNTLRLSLVEASNGHLGSPRDWMVLACFVYDPKSGSYTFAAVRLMRWGAGVTIAAVLFGSLPFWFRRSPRSIATAGAQVETVPIDSDSGLGAGSEPTGESDREERGGIR